MTFPTATDTSNKCLHCGVELKATKERAKLGLFCCTGCRAVYETITSLGLTDFYSLRDQYFTPSQSQDPSLRQWPTFQGSGDIKRFHYLDDEAFHERYTKRQDNDTWLTEFYLEGIYCAACIWLLEKLPELCPGVRRAEVSVANSTITLEYNSAVKLSEIARILDSLGYTPYPLEPDIVASSRLKEDRLSLLRIGIAGVGAGNAMMFAISIYSGWFSGMEQQFLDLFNWLSLLVTIPVMFYSALPFYRSALSGLKAGLVTIELPITLALIAATIFSINNTVFSTGEVYYDTICALVFLLLISRYLQRRALATIGTRTNLLGSLTSSVARVITNGEEKEVYVGSVKAGDLLAVNPGETICTDGLVEKGSSNVDLSILTGESIPVRSSVGTHVYAGSRNLDSHLLIRAACSPAESRMGRLLASTQIAQKTPLVEFTDIASRYFVAITLALSLITLFGWWYYIGLESALKNVLSLLIVSCPCALGFSAPLALAAAVKRQAKLGVLIKRHDVFERLQKTKEIFFDKTGTLSQADLEVVSVFAVKQSGLPGDASLREFQPLECLPLSADTLAVLRTLESASAHPIAKAMCRFVDQAVGFSHTASEVHTKDPDAFFIKPDSLQQTSVSREGVSGADRLNRIWRVGSLSFLQRNGITLPKDFPGSGAGLTIVGLAVEERLIAVFTLRDHLRNEALQTIQFLKKNGLLVSILSGDSSQTVEWVGKELGISAKNTHGDLLPEDKLEIVQSAEKIQRTVMVGDGINDAASLAAASVGIGISGGAAACLKACDVYLAKPDLNLIITLFHAANQASLIVKLNLGISAVYNLTAVTVAMAGLMNPLLAAIIMPLSSLTVMLTSLYFPHLSLRAELSLQNPFPQTDQEQPVALE